MSAIYVVGDVHGQYVKLATLLLNVGLVDENLRWTGGDSHLWFLGDLVDRGPDGIDVVELVMSLQNQAARAGGMVQSLIGNHEMLLLSAYRFGRSRALFTNAPKDLPIGSVDMFTAEWLYSGGVPRDLTRMTGKHAAWMSHLPAMAKVGDRLLIHADAVFYQRYGDYPDGINALFRDVLASDDQEAWSSLLDGFSEHKTFLGTGGAERAARFLRMFGSAQLIHGHTPIQKITDQHPAEPLVYARGLCVNVDGGMYLGGEGFVYPLD